MLAGYEIEMHPLETLSDTTYLLGWTLHHEGWLYAPYLSFLLLSKINICRLWDDHTNIGKFKVDESLRLSDTFYFVDNHLQDRIFLWWELLQPRYQRCLV